MFKVTFSDNNASLNAQFRDDANARLVANFSTGGGGGGGRGVAPGGLAGDVLMKRTNADYDTEWVTPASQAEQDNTRPITAAAVYNEIGNINALLATI